MGAHPRSQFIIIHFDSACMPWINLSDIDTVNSTSSVELSPKFESHVYMYALPNMSKTIAVIYMHTIIITMS